MLLFFCFCSVFFLFCFYTDQSWILRPWLCLATIYRFREVISRSQESKSIGSRVIKSPCGFVGIFLSSSLPPRLSHSPFVFLSYVSFHSSPHQDFPSPGVSLFPSRTPFIDLCSFLLTVFDLSSCFSGYHKSLCQFITTVIYLPGAEWGLHQVSSQFYSWRRNSTEEDMALPIWAPFRTV